MAKKTTTKKSTVGKTSKAGANKTSAASAGKKRSTKTTKTTKVPKASATKKTVASKKKSTTSKSLAAGVGKQIRSKFGWLNSTMHGLRGLHLFSAAVFAVLIGFIFTLMETVNRTAVAGYAASDALQGDVLAPAVRDVYTVDMRYALAALLGIAVVYSLFVATRGWQTYLARAEKGPLVSRWLFAGLMGAAGIKIVAMLNGVYDVLLLSLLALLIAVAAFVAYRADAEVGVKRKATLFLTAVALVVIAVVALVVFTAFSMIYGVTLPLHIYLAIDVFALALLAYAVIQLSQLRGRKGFTKPAVVERNYVIASTLALTLFSAILLASNVAA